MSGLLIMISAIVIVKNAASLETAQRDFNMLGFETKPIVGGSLMISGDESLFSKVFGTTLEVDKSGAVKSLKDGKPSVELSVQSLPDSMRSYIGSIGFQEPIDFGPTSY